MKVRRVLPSQSAKFLSSLLLSSPPHSGNVELAETGGQLQEGPPIKARRADWENKLITDCPPASPPATAAPEQIWFTLQSPLWTPANVWAVEIIPPREVSCLHLGKIAAWSRGKRFQACPPLTRLCSVGGRSAEHRTSKVTLDMSNCVKICRSPFWSRFPPSSLYAVFRPPDPFTVNL